MSEPCRDTLCLTASIEVAVPAQVAFEYLSDGIRQGDWTLGSWDRAHVRDSLFRGRSLFHGGEVYVRIDADPTRLLIDYEVGPDPDQLRRVNSARAIPGPLLARPEDTCIVTLMKWRTPDQSEESWKRDCATFSAEIHMIKGRLELGF